MQTLNGRVQYGGARSDVISCLDLLDGPPASLAHVVDVRTDVCQSFRLLRRFEGLFALREKSGEVVGVAGTGTLNRGVTINGANHVIILNTEWSPETTLQAEDRCHRTGQTKEVFVHYILSAGTMEEQMWELIQQKAAAQRAVFDKEALYKSVEEVMNEAVSAQMQIAKAVIEIERELLPAPEAVSVQPSVVSPEHSLPVGQPATHNAQPTTVENAAQKSYVGAAQLALTDLFQKLGAQGKGQRKRKPVILPEQQLSLFGALAATD